MIFVRTLYVVGVPIAEVVNTLANWLRWMAGSYVGHLNTKMASLRSTCLNT
jgi:fructose-specific phosphotransferase system IIC component